MQRIINFLKENEIPYNMVCHTSPLGVETPIFVLNDGKTELWYIESGKYPIDYSHRWGEDFKGVRKDYFERITLDKMKDDIRVIYIKDYELDFNKPLNGSTEDNFRMWNVLQSYILTACGKIETRYFARDCEIREISNAEVRDFLETNCFYGHRNASVNLGFFAKKDKNGVKAGTLIFVYTFGTNFFGGKSKSEKAEEEGLTVEVIRVASKLKHQCIGAASRSISYFQKKYKELYIKSRDKSIKVKELKFYVDLDHNSCQSMDSLGFKKVSMGGNGFMNFAMVDLPELNVKANKPFQRMPLKHKYIMQLMEEKKVISIPTAGVGHFILDLTEENAV